MLSITGFLSNIQRENVEFSLWVLIPSENFHLQCDFCTIILKIKIKFITPSGVDHIKYFIVLAF
mgnify:CR=1 FL=1